MVTVYEYSNCSTCKKALKHLEKKGVSFKKADITESPPSKAELKKMLGFYDGDLRRLFNTSGVLYRELKIKDKLPKMSESEAISLLSKHGKLIKRPFLITKKGGVVGFKEDEWKKVL